MSPIRSIGTPHAGRVVTPSLTAPPHRSVLPRGGGSAHPMEPAGPAHPSTGPEALAEPAGREDTLSVEGVDSAGWLG
jgi:hypothetical protein